MLKERNLLLICATRPSAQSSLIMRLPKIPKYLWLEKPLSIDSESTDDISALLNNSVCVINAGPLYSVFWEEAKREIAKENQRIIEIAVTWNSPRRTRSYISRLWDYGFHDFVLLLDLFGNELVHDIEYFKRNCSISQEALQCNIRSRNDSKTLAINFSYSYEASKVRTWNVFFEDGQVAQIDFLNLTIERGELVLLGTLGASARSDFEKPGFDEFLRLFAPSRTEMRKKLIYNSILTAKLLNEIHEQDS